MVGCRVRQQGIFPMGGEGSTAKVALTWTDDQFQPRAVDGVGNPYYPGRGTKIFSLIDPIHGRQHSSIR